MNAVSIAEDDLYHETYHTELGYEKPKHLPILLKLAAEHSLYIRVHRRQGTERVLEDWEFSEWAKRLHEIANEEATFCDGSRGKLKGPIFFLIGTDHEDQPIINSNKLEAALKQYEVQKGILDLNNIKNYNIDNTESLWLDWKNYVKQLKKNTGTSMLNYFATTKTNYANQTAELKSDSNNNKTETIEIKDDNENKRKKPSNSSDVISNSKSISSPTKKLKASDASNTKPITNFFKKQ